MATTSNRHPRAVARVRRTSSAGVKVALELDLRTALLPESISFTLLPPISTTRTRRGLVTLLALPEGFFLATGKNFSQSYGRSVKMCGMRFSRFTASLLVLGFALLATGCTTHDRHQYRYKKLSKSSSIGRRAPAPMPVQAMAPAAQPAAQGTPAAVEPPLPVQ